MGETPTCLPLHQKTFFSVDFEILNPPLTPTMAWRKQSTTQVIERLRENDPALTAVAFDGDSIFQLKSDEKTRDLCNALATNTHVETVRNRSSTRAEQRAERGAQPADATPHPSLPSPRPLQLSLRNCALGNNAGEALGAMLVRRFLDNAHASHHRPRPRGHARMLRR